MMEPRFITKNDILQILNAKNHKINAIKVVRTVTGLGLKEAKDFLEQQCIPMLNGEIQLQPDEVKGLKE